MVLKKSLLLEGIILKKGSRIQEITPSKEKLIFQGKLQEFVRMSDLMDKSGLSDFTRPFEQERQRIMGGANKNTKLIQVDFDDEYNPIFSWLADATDKYGEDHKYKEVDPENGFKIIDDPSKTYTLKIKILDFLDWLNTHPDIKSVKEKDVKEILDVANIQAFSSSPGFMYQGLNYNLSVLDGSLYPTDIAPTPGPRGWLDRQGDMAFTDKHLTQLFSSMKFWYSPMASMLTKRLREEGLI